MVSNQYFQVAKPARKREGIMKDVPFFPLYAANIMASRPFRMMNLEQRGLWITLMMECWVNGSVPSNSIDMAKFLGLPAEEVSRSISSLQTFSLDEQGSHLISKELEEYREGYLKSREGKSRGGKLGAERKREKQRQKELGNPQGIPKGEPKGSLIQFKSNSLNSNQLIKKGVMSEENKAWVNEYENTPDFSNDYLRTSKG